MTEAVIAPGTRSDLPAVMTVMSAAFDPAFGEAWTKPQCEGLIGLPGVWLTLARDPGGAPLGFALSRVVVDEAELLLLAVVPEARRRGIGRQLLDAVLAEATARGARQLHLEMRDGNPAEGLYRAAGFVTAGRRPGYYVGGAGGPIDAITLVLASGKSAA